MNPKDPIDRLTFVPWRKPEDFIKVYDCLYSYNISQQRWATDQIAVWSTQCEPALPAAIESTACIMSAIIKDTLYIDGRLGITQLDMELAYSGAIIRFVSSIFERHQKASNISMSAFATKHKIPPWFIDLRNEIVHSYMPSLSLMRSAADIALEYLKETFWSKEAASKKEIFYDTSEVGVQILDLINQYKNLQFKRLNKEKPARLLKKDMKSVFKKMCCFISCVSELFIDVLVKPGNFISARDLTKLPNLEVRPFLEDKTNLVLPDCLQKFWLPVLCNIHKKDLMPTFLHNLLLAQGDCQIKICNKTAIAWAFEIFGAEQSKSLLTPVFEKKGLLLNVYDVMYSCSIRPNRYTRDLLLRMVDKDIDKQKYERICFLVALYQGDFLPDEDTSSKRKSDTDLDIVFSIEDVENELNAKKMRTEKDENIWSLAPVTMDFSSIPIGAVINPLKKDEEQMKPELSVDVDLIPINNDDERIMEETTCDTFPAPTVPVGDEPDPEDFDMVYRRHLQRKEASEGGS